MLVSANSLTDASDIDFEQQCQSGQSNVKAVVRSVDKSKDNWQSRAETRRKADGQRVCCLTVLATDSHGRFVVRERT
jgi:hypothetical protein